VTAGRLNKQIAADLRVCERSVKAYRAGVMAKLGAATAADLGRIAERLRATDA
jgi:FixJ family two-component response regulator